jgi:hypothetical protein
MVKSILFSKSFLVNLLSPDKIKVNHFFQLAGFHKASMQKSAKLVGRFDRRRPSELLYLMSVP